MADQSSSSFWGGLLFGAAVGLLCGLAFAPRSGKESRRMIKNTLDGLPNTARDTVDSVQFGTNRMTNTLIDDSRKRIDETIQRLQEALDAGKRATQEYRDRHRETNGMTATPDRSE